MGLLILALLPFQLFLWVSQGMINPPSDAPGFITQMDQ